MRHAKRFLKKLKDGWGEFLSRLALAMQEEELKIRREDARRQYEKWVIMHRKTRKQYQQWLNMHRKTMSPSE
jgi:hypothetical protein